MTTAYLDDKIYHRLIDVVLDNIGGKLASEHRDRLMFAIGEEAGVWPESSREETEAN